MLFFLFLFSCIRIKEILGEIGRIQYLSGNELQNFLKSNEMSIIFYSNPDNESREELSFANAAITIYKEAISFALGNPKDAPSELCPELDQKKSFCIVPYEGSNPLQYDNAPNTAPAFLNWIDLISHPKITAILSINKLNKLLNRNETCIFAVDVQEELIDTIDIPKEKKIYMVSADLFLIYNLTLSQGVYLYRPNDRQILKLDDNNKFDFLSSKENMMIQPYETIDTDKSRQNRLICGFTLNESDSALCEEQYKILFDLTKNLKLNDFSSLFNNFDDLNKYFVFTIVKSENIETFANMTCMRSVPAPYFFIVNVTKPSRLRWVYEKSDIDIIDDTGNNIYNYSYIIELLYRIYLGQEDPYIVSEFDLNEVSQNEDIKNEKNESESSDQITEQNIENKKNNNKQSSKTNKRRRPDNDENQQIDEETIIDKNIEKYSKLSIQKVVGKTFNELVFDDYYETIVLFTSPNSTKYKFFKPIVNAVAYLLNKTGFRFFYMDVSKNDVPESVPPLKKFPTLILWPAGHKDEPIIYDGNNTFIDVLNFVHKYAGHKIKLPRYDLDSVKEKLAAILNKIRFGDKA